MLIGLFVILICALVGGAVFFVLQKKKQQPTLPPSQNKIVRPPVPPVSPQNVANVPPTGMANRLQSPPPPPPEPKTVSVEESINIAQSFISQQRYDEAINELKKGLTIHPNHSELLVKLLNIFALTKQTDNFTALYEKIQKQGDPQAQKQATDLKNLLDAEEATKNTFKSHETEEVDEALDFDWVTDEEATQTQEAPKPQAEPTPAPNLAEDSAFDLSFEDAQPAKAEENFATLEEIDAFAAEPSADKADDLAFDLSEDLAFEEPAQSKVPEQASLDDLSFDLSEDLGGDLDFADKAEDKVANIVETQSEPQDLGADFGFDLADLNAEPAAQASASVETKEVDGFDLSESFDDFALDIEETPAKTESAPTAEVVLEDDFSFDLEETVSPAPKAVEDASQKAVEDAPQDAFALDMDALDEAQALDFADSEPSKPTETAQDLSLDSFDFAEVASELTPATKVSEPALDDTLALDVDFEEVPATPAPEEVVPKAVELETEAFVAPSVAPADLGTDFGFVQGLDNNQITLELAGQYLQLGEHDSAKRLLQEVLEKGNSDQQQQAKTLLARVA